MSRSFLLLSLLKEADVLDKIANRRQAQSIRSLHLISRGPDVVHIYRLTEDLLRDLEDDLSPLLPCIQQERGLTNRIKLLCTLSFLANGSYQKIIGKNINTYLSQTSTSRSLHQIINALNHPTIVKKFIRFPQDAAERQALKERFYDKFKIPGVIGYTDGTLVAMVRPKEHEERYYCRKGYHARNVQLITDADLNILHVDATYGGASHDSFIFSHSEIKNHLEEITSTTEEVVYLLGDSGYAQRPYLMTPIINAAENSPEAYYTKQHATARNSIERAIGILKGRFRCLLVHRVLHYHPDMVAKIVVACCVLHNLCNRAGVPAPVLSSEDILNEERLLSNIQHDNETGNTELDMGRIVRSELVNRLWRSRNLQ